MTTPAIKACNRLIFIDDDPLSNGLNRIIAKRATPGFLVETFENPALGIEFITQFHPSTELIQGIIFLDINMPGLNGWMVLNNLATFFEKDNFPFIIYMLSSSIDKKDIEKANDHDLVRGYLYKPLLIETLSGLADQYRNEYKIVEIN